MTLGAVDRGVPVQCIDNVIADRIRVIADDIKAFAQINALDHIVDHQRFCGKTDGGEKSCLRSKNKEGGGHCGHIHQHQHGSDIQAGVLLQDHGDDIRSAAGCADIEQDRCSDSREENGKHKLQ